MEEIDIELDDLYDGEIPSLYDINCSFDVIKTENYTGIVGEDEARMVIFTNFILGQKPVILRGSRASGKTNIIKVTSVYAKNPIEMASSSEKAYKRYEKLNDHTHIIVPEINKVNENAIEMLKDFGEGASSTYTYTTPSKKTKTVKIDPKAFITSIADENKNINMLGEELLSRVTVVRTDNSVDQNNRVIEEKLKRAQNPYYKKDVSQEDVKQYIEYVHALPSIKNYGFIYPAGPAIKQAIPALFTDSRRDTDKYLYNTYGITLFHYNDRLTKTIKGKEHLIVTPADIWYNHQIYQDVMLASSLKCGNIEKQILRIIKEAREEDSPSEWEVDVVEGLSSNDVHSRLLNEKYTVTRGSVKKMCESLSEIGYLIKNEEVRPHKYEINPALDDDFSTNIDWKKIVDACERNIYKMFGEESDISQQYVKRFCRGDGLKVIHPFEGDERYIIPEEEQEDVETTIMRILSDEEAHAVDEIIDEVKYSEKEVTDKLKKLENVGIIIEVKSGFVQKL